MSPEAIHSLIKLFGVEKGIHIINLFTAMDDLELTQQYRQVRPSRPSPSQNLLELKGATSETPLATPGRIAPAPVEAGAR